MNMNITYIPTNEMIKLNKLKLGKKSASLPVNEIFK